MAWSIQVPFIFCANRVRGALRLSRANADSCERLWSIQKNGAQNLGAKVSPFDNQHEAALRIPSA
ncbi:hypothetical protein HDE77_000493 [Rhodanobacter sp. MP7CTX1]|nr:hypothetical protein [Rhodanobacter sp. MP7CTX1]